MHGIIVCEYGESLPSARLGDRPRSGVRDGRRPCGRASVHIGSSVEIHTQILAFVQVISSLVPTPSADADSTSLRYLFREVIADRVTRFANCKAASILL